MRLKPRPQSTKDQLCYDCISKSLARHTILPIHDKSPASSITSSYFCHFPSVHLNQSNQSRHYVRLHPGRPAEEPLSALKGGLSRGYCTLNYRFPQKTPNIMSFSSLVSDLAFRDNNPNDQASRASRPSARSTTGSYARSYASTAATSVSISGDISSQLHGGYGHPLTRSWQAERQLTKVLQPLVVRTTLC